MIGTKLYQRKSQARFFLAMYVLLALAGGGLATLSIRSGQDVSGASGFMMIFGLGMAINTLIKSRKAQVSVHDEHLEVNQSRTPRTVRYRDMTGISRPDRNRLVITHRGERGERNEVIWLKELDPAEVGRLYDFLTKRRGKGA